MQEYFKGAKIISQKGFNQRPARAGLVGTKVYSSLQMRFDLSKGEVPILTSKAMPFKLIMSELLWFLRGDTNIKYLLQENNHIWTDNGYKWHNQLVEEEGLPYPIMTAEEYEEAVLRDKYEPCVRPNGTEYRVGDLGKIYSYQWRMRPGCDQLVKALQLLKVNPTSRQNKVVAWVPEDMDYKHVAQPNCHGDFTITGRPLDGEARIKLLKEKLQKDNLSFNIQEVNAKLDEYGIPKYEFSFNLNQRSGDFALGVPFNITSYAMMMYIFGILTNMVPKMLIMTINDAHVYADHLNTLRGQIEREPRALPTFTIKDWSWKDLAGATFPTKKDLDMFLSEFKANDFKLVDYKPHPPVNYKLHTGTPTKKQ